MSGQQNKIRIYDLAKELKLDNKKVIDDARREGIDVSVPSNSVPLEVAERIRTKYFPKKALPAAGPRLVKTVKKVETAPASAQPGLGSPGQVQSSHIKPRPAGDLKTAGNATAGDRDRGAVGRRSGGGD